MEIIPGIHQIQAGTGSANVFLLVFTDHLTLIDAGMPGSSDKILSYAQDLGRSPEDITHVLITHGDIDHIGGLAALKAQTGAAIYVHPGDAPLLTGSGWRQPSLGGWKLGLYRLVRAILRRLVIHYTPVEADELLEDGDVIDGLTVIHTPGHSPGHVVLYDADRKILFTGDAIVNFRGLDPPPRLATPNMAQAQDSIQRLTTLDFEICCFGHGPPLTEGAAVKVREFAAELSDE